MYSTVRYHPASTPSRMPLTIARPNPIANSIRLTWKFLNSSPEAACSARPTAMAVGFEAKKASISPVATTVSQTPNITAKEMTPKITGFIRW